MKEQEQRIERVEEKMEEREQRVEERLMERMTEGELTKKENCLKVLKPISLRTDILPTELPDELDTVVNLVNRYKVLKFLVLSYK